ncbi:DKNYY domain-containing protein [Serratia sp. DD3]|uniref:DKNYY domain-containing protein n=1 Tax=Serratia sp. DD3 TaxID=1410619 RepID=UPI0003C5193B|nr:DKNYY domain-containing protein [Serratia sp. DD3]KEY59280.1 hypothetical protein SRDD_15590 [Serratia sp. DD3]
MAEPQYLFAEIPLSRAAFDRWLKSTPPPATQWPEWSGFDLQEQEGEQSVLEALMPFFIAEQDLQRCLLLHDKQQGVLRCALWLCYEEMRQTMIEMLALLRSTAPFMTAKAQAQVQHGENCCGTLFLSRSETRWIAECEQLTFPDWANDWLSSLGDEQEESGSQWMDAKLFNQLKRRYNHYLLNASPEKPIHIKKTEYHSYGSEVVDFYGNRIPGANPLTFKRICNNYFHKIYTDGQGVWIDSDLVGLHQHKIADNISPERMQVWEIGCDDDFLLRIDNTLWFIAQDETPGPFFLRSLTIDADSFRQLTACKYADKNAVYGRYGNRGIRVVERLHPDDIVRTIDNFILTETQVFCFGKPLPGADVKSFKKLESGYYGDEYYCDEEHVWLGNHLLENLNPKTLRFFTFVESEHKLVTDGQWVYLGEQLIPEADPLTLEVLLRGMSSFWRDKSNIWYSDGKLKGADVTHNDVEIYRGSIYCRIGERIWCQHTELEDVDVDSFAITAWNQAQDKNGRFYFSRRRDYED